MTEIHNLIIVDESGSMCGLEQATLSGINETIATIKQAQKQFAGTQRHYLTLVTFDSPGMHNQPVRTIIDDAPIEAVSDFAGYDPQGCTPLYDAVGSSLTRLHKKIKSNPDATGVVTIITDGMENSSTEWNSLSLAQLIKQLKEEGWTFSYMGSTHDVKSVTKILCIENVVEFDHDARSTSSTWSRERSAKMAYYDRMSRDDYRNMSRVEQLEEKKRMAANYYSDRVTPARIDHPKIDEVIVFGCDRAGMHTGGLARIAVERWGAQMGVGEGPQGRCYAIPTTGCSLHETAYAISRLINYARQHRDTRFLVTEVGCGHAGYTPHEIAPFFSNAVEVENISLPASFWKILGLKF